MKVAIHRGRHKYRFQAIEWWVNIWWSGNPVIITAADDDYPVIIYRCVKCGKETSN